MHKVVIKGNYYGRTRTLPDLNDYLHECARHPQMGAKMKRDYQMIVCNAIRTQLPRLTITNPIIIHYNFYEPDKQRDKWFTLPPRKRNRCRHTLKSTVQNIRPPCFVSRLIR